MSWLKGSSSWGSGLGRWEALAQSDPMGRSVEMQTLGEPDIESGGLMASISQTFGNMTGMNKPEPVVEPQSALEAGMSSLAGLLPNAPELSYMQKLAGFGLCLLVAVLMSFYCFTLLPTLFLGGSSKFAMCYLLVNFCFTTASCFIVSPSTQLKAFFSKDRILVSTTYVVTTTLTMYVCLFHPYMYLVAPLLILQILSLFSYIISYTPCASMSMAPFRMLLSMLNLG